MGGSSGPPFFIGLYNSNAILHLGLVASFDTDQKFDKAYAYTPILHSQHAFKLTLVVLILIDRNLFNEDGVG